MYGLLPIHGSEIVRLRYFFHLRDGQDQLLDPDGRELASLEAVQAATLREARSLISHDALDGHIRLDQRLEVQSRDGRVVHTLSLADAVTITGL